MSTDNYNDNFWNNPNSPWYSALGEDAGDKERDPSIGAFVFHLDEDEMEDLHNRVHDNVGDWLKTRVAINEIDIADHIRMASHCLAYAFAGGFLKNIEESESLEDDQVCSFARMCIQIGYAMRQDEGDGELSL